MDKLLICTVGLPRIGKSTWSKKQGLPIVNPDAVRLALHGQAFIKEAEQMVWAMTEYMINSLFIAGHDKIILDATNTTVKRRSKWNNVYTKNMYNTAFKVFDPNKDLCIQRAMEGQRHDLIPIIERMWISYEVLSEGECVYE